MKILVSACLLGEACRYDGASKPVEAMRELEARGYELIPVCPEVLGGLDTPRSPAELQEDGRVVNRQGTDVTAQYRRGAQAALEMAQRERCTLAVLKEKSPSCGSKEIYDGSFSRRLVPGMGVAAQLLQSSGITVLGESQLDVLLKE